jgi:hypothetical protein
MFSNDPRSEHLGESQGEPVMDESVSALSSLYQSEKADASSIFNVAMTMMGVAAAYLVGALSIADKYGTTAIPWFVVPFLPIPLWLVAAFHSLIALNGMRHGLSVQILEEALFRRSGLPAVDRELIGSKTGDRIMDIQRSAIPHKIATVFTYGGVAISIIAYTVFGVVSSWAHFTAVWRGAEIALYTLAAVIVASSWRAGLRSIAADTAKWRTTLWMPAQVPTVTVG